MRFAPQRRALFPHLNFQKRSELEAQREQGPIAQAAQEGRLNQVAYVDPSDPSERTNFEIDTPSAPPPEGAGQQPRQNGNCLIS
eukprot:s5105_g5.t1